MDRFSLIPSNSPSPLKSPSLPHPLRSHTNCSRTLPGLVDAHLADHFVNEMIRSFSDSAAHSLTNWAKLRKMPQALKPLSNPSSLQHSDQLPIINHNHLQPSLDQLNLHSAQQPLQSDQDHTSHIQIDPYDLDHGLKTRIDAAGYRVGWILAERLAKDKSRFPRTSSSDVPSASVDQLEVIKFICKEVWLAMYSKQADNLRTNHRGIYVIQDHGYRPFLRLSSPLGFESEMDELCRQMMIFPLAVIRGVLMNLGVQCIVSAEIAVPQCTFQIRTAATAAASSTSGNATTSKS